MGSIIAWIKGLSLTAKIISAVVAGVVVIGGTTTAIIVATNSGGNDPADTGAPTSSVSESLTSEIDSTDTSTAESEVTSSTEESSSTAASSQPDGTSSKKPDATTSSQTPTTSTAPPASQAPQPAAFSVYINGKAVDLGTLERVTQKVTITKDMSNKTELAGDVYVDAEKLAQALGMQIMDNTTQNAIQAGGISTAENGKKSIFIFIARNETENGYTIRYIPIIEGLNTASQILVGFGTEGVQGAGLYAEHIASSLNIKTINGKIYIPASSLCEAMGYNYELKDTGLYITK